jgi:hypothetical protein
MIKLQKQSTMLAALALALGMSAGAIAQSTGGDSSGAAGGGQGGGNTATSSTFQNWLNKQSGKKISRQAYLDEVGRRWDAADTSKQGLTTDEINRMYWNAGVGMGGPTATQPNQKKGLQQ